MYIHIHLSNLQGVVLHVVRCSEHSMADVLANRAVDNPEIVLDTCWQEMPFDNLREECDHISIKDLNGLSGSADRSHEPNY